LIDYRLVEIASRIPWNLKLKNKQEKYILRKALEDLLPNQITERKKKGFVIPMGDWMRHELRPVVKSCLSKESAVKRGIFNPDFIVKLKEDFFNGKQPFFKVWNQVVFELWCRIVIDRKNGWQKPSQDIRDFI